MVSLSMRHQGDSWPVVWHDTGVSADFLLSLLEWLQSSFFSSIFRKYQCMSCSFFYSLLFSLASGPATIVSSLTFETPPLTGSFLVPTHCLDMGQTKGLLVASFLSRLPQHHKGSSFYWKNLKMLGCVPQCSELSDFH